MSSTTRTGVHVPVAALAVVTAGVAAALHIGKLPPAVPALQAGLGIGLVEAGFLLSLVQLAGMTLGIFVGLAADTIGLRRSMISGLTLVSAASFLGGFVGISIHDKAQALPLLLVLRALEGFGFLLAVMPGPGLIRSVVPPSAEKAAMGLWGAYMPLGVALALLAGPVFIAWLDWPDWWLGLALLSLAAAAWVAWVVPGDSVRAHASSGIAEAWPKRLRETAGASGPWTLALAFAVYSSQWMAVIGFLPAIYVDAGVPASWTAALTAFAAATNIVGNVTGGRLLQRGVAPDRLLRLGFGVMALGGIAAFAQIGAPQGVLSLPPLLRYLAVCMFSLAGGMVPATLFMLGVRLAPGPSTVSTTIGFMQQASSLGQFVAPPFVAWIAHRAGGWQWTWVVTLACSLMGIALANRLSPALPRAGTA
ncbi:MAG: MFS transporter [Variovorax sp.]|nr:MFS transporter [Variovorax sp.]